MAAPTQLVQFTFAGGIDQSIRSEALDPAASFVLVENARARTRAGLYKRYGFSAMTLNRLGGTTRSAAYRMFAHDQQVCVIDGDTLDAYSGGLASFVSRGRVPECGLSMMKIPTPPAQSGLVITDACICGNYLVVAYSSASAGIYMAVVDATNGAVVRAPEIVLGASVAETYAKLGTYSTYVVSVSVEAGTGATRLRYIDTANLSAGWTTAYGNLGGDRSVNNLALGVVSLTDRIAAAYVNNSGGTDQITVKTFTIAALLETATINTNSIEPASVALDGSIADTLWVAWNEANWTYVKGLDADNLASALATTSTVCSLAGSLSAFDGVAVVASSTAGAGKLFVNDASGSRIRMATFTTSAGAVLGGTQINVYNTTFCGYPFRVGTRYYAPCYGYDSTEKVVILCDLTESNSWARPVANVAPRLASMGVASCRSVAKTSREYWCPVGVQTAGNVVSAQIAKFDFDASARWRPVRHNGVTFLTGGILSTFDGLRVAESAFLIRPPAPVLATNGAGTFSATTGVSVVLTYEQVDSAGNWHISGVSEPTSSGAFTNKVNLEVTYRPLGISARIGETTDPTIRIGIWATEDGGSTYYLVTTKTNTLTAASATHNITAHVAGTTALLYGTGALPGTGAGQDRRAPCGLTHLVSYNGFLVGAQGEDLYWSGQDVSGEGTWWNPLFSQPVSGGGDITALECFEGTLYAFKRDRIFALAGSPPSDTGTEGGLGAPQRLGVSTGAAQPFTCVTELGIFFVSERGIELMTGRAVDFIGEQVKDTFASYPYVTAMTYDPASSCVVIECAASFSAGQVSGSGRALIFDTKSRVWRSVDRRKNSAGTADTPAQDGAMVWTGSAWRYAWLGTDGRVYVEDQTTYLDPGSAFVRMYAKTAYVKLAGIQGQQIMNRALLLAKKSTRSDINMAASYDYDATFETATFWTANTLDTLSSALGRIQVGHDLHAAAEGQAVSVEVYDATPTGGTVGTGEGAAWVALTFEGQPRANAALLPQEAR